MEANHPKRLGHNKIAKPKHLAAQAGLKPIDSCDHRRKFSFISPLTGNHRTMCQDCPASDIMGWGGH